MKRPAFARTPCLLVFLIALAGPPVTTNGDAQPAATAASELRPDPAMAAALQKATILGSEWRQLAQEYGWSPSRPVDEAHSDGIRERLLPLARERVAQLRHANDLGNQMQRQITATGDPATARDIGDQIAEAQALYLEAVASERALVIWLDLATVHRLIESGDVESAATLSARLTAEPFDAALATLWKELAISDRLRACIGELDRGQPEGVLETLARLQRLIQLVMDDSGRFEPLIRRALSLARMIEALEVLDADYRIALANADVGDGSLRRRADELAAAVGDLRGRVQAEAESLGRALESVSDRSSLGPESAEGSTAGQDVAAYGVRSAATLAGRTEISDAFAELRAATVSGRYREGVRGAERLAASLDRATFGRQSVRRLQGLSNECGRLSEMIRAGRFLVAREGLQRLIAATSPLQNGWAGDTPELESIGSAPTLRRAIEARLERHERILADPEVAQLRRTRQLEVSVGAEAERRSNLRVLAESRRAELAATQLQILGALASIGSFDPEAAKQKDVVALMGQLRELRIEGDRRFEELNQALVLTEDLSSLNAVAQLERLARLDEERLIALSRLSGELVARQGAGGIRRDLAELEAQSLYWMAQATIAKSRSTGGQGSAIPAALVHLESGLDALPEHPLLKTAQVELLLEIHQYQQALDAATGAMAAAVSTTARGAGAASARLHLARSRAFRALGRPQKSARDLVEALALRPSRAVLMHFFAESRKAEAALIPSQVESVINSIQSVFPHDDDSIDANSRLSAGEWLLQLAGPAGLAEAVEQCRIAFASAFFETPTEVSRRRFRELATEPLWAPVRALDEWRVVESRFSAATPPGMVRIPETTFMMGSAREDDPREERPARRVTVTSFLMDAREVSVADYAAFVEAQGGRIAPPPDWALQKRQPDDPVRGVDWHAAMAYAKWNGKSLPSEAQWEAAARGADSRPYPWGTAMDDRQWQSRPSSTSGSIAPPTWDVTTEGVIGLAFGVREWTRDDFLPDYHRTRLHDGIQNPEVVGEGLVKTVKGGHHRVGRPYHVQPMRRQGVNADAMDPTIGFRCVIP